MITSEISTLVILLDSISFFSSFLCLRFKLVREYFVNYDLFIVAHTSRPWLIRLFRRQLFFLYFFVEFAWHYWPVEQPHFNVPNRDVWICFTFQALNRPGAG